MSALIPVILSLLETILPAINSSGTIAKIIATLVQIIPIVVKEVQDLVPMVKNIIAALKSTDGITEDQLAQLEALDAQCDADFETAATIATQTIDDSHPNAHTEDATGALDASHPNAA